MHNILMDHLTCDRCGGGLLLDAPVRYEVRIEVKSASDPLEVMQEDLDRAADRMKDVLAQLEERRDSDPPPFEERQVQRILRQFFMQERDERILGFERALLSRDSYSWLHPGLRRLRDTASAQVPLPPR